jgi:hypothetical protein
MSLSLTRRVAALGLPVCLALGTAARGGDDDCRPGRRKLLHRHTVVVGHDGVGSAAATFETRVGGDGVRYVLVVECRPCGRRSAAGERHRQRSIDTLEVALNGAVVFETRSGCHREQVPVALNPVGGPANTFAVRATGSPGARAKVSVVAFIPRGGHADPSCNTPPSADAGPDQTLAVGSTAVLDGSGSTDADGDELSYAWTLQSAPPGSQAALSDPTAVDPTFTLDVPGTYLAQLVVHDGTASSAPDSVAVTTENSPPVADAGPDQTVAVGQTVALDGGGSTDVDGDALSYAWTLLSRPPGSAAALSDPVAVDPTLVADVAGSYEVQLVVSDGLAGSAPDTVLVTTRNSPPVADAGPDQSVPVGTQVALDGSGSTDVDGDALSYAWSLNTVPSGSLATLSNPAAVAPTFVVDLPGSYVAQLVVDDGAAASAPDTVVVTTDNAAPVADAGPDQTVVAGQLVTLDGTGSSDADGDPLSFRWSFTTRPPGSTAALSDETSPAPSFTADLPGRYVVQLIVNDGALDGAPDTVAVDTSNSAPVADAGPDQAEVPLGGPVTLDGSGSSDADGHPLSYAWSLLTRPPGSLASLAGATTVAPGFTPDVVGDYVAQLVVNDGFADSAPDTVRVSTEAPVVSVIATDAAAAEAGLDPGAISVSRTGPTTNALTVMFSVGGAATDGVDYVGLGSSVTIPAGAEAVTLALTPIDDALVEGPEDVVLALQPDAAYLLGGPLLAGVVIADDDLAAVSIEASDPDASEAGPDPGRFTIHRTGDTAAPLRVVLALGGTALDSDYVGFNLSPTIPAGADAITIDVAPRADNLVEGPETVALTISPSLDYVAGTPDTATVTILDDPAVVTLVASDPDAAEAGLETGAFLLARSGGDLNAELSVGFEPSGTATDGSDYVASGSPSFPAGQSSATVTVTPLADNLVESAETVTFTIVASTGFVSSGPISATVTIADDPPVVNVTATDSDASEAGPDPGRFSFTRAGGNLAAALDVAFTRGGTASPSDYADVGSGVTLPANQTTASVTITPLADALVEGVETVVLTVAPGDSVVVGTPGSATVTIADDPLPVVSVVATDAAATEAGDTGTFTISRSGNLTLPLDVGFTLAGTATNGVDYVTLPATATLPAGADSVTLTVAPIDDADIESSEGVQLQLSPRPEYIVGTPSSAIVSISDDDTLVSVVASDPVAAENGPDTGTFTLSRLGPAAEPLTVSYAVSGTAAAGLDYVALPGRATFPAGAPEATVTIEPLDDALLEGPETAVLTLGPGDGYKVGALGAATVTIQDDERPAVGIVVSDGAAGEAGPDVGSFSISRTGPTTGTLTVFYDAVGAATQGVDYEALAGSVTIPAGSASAEVVITPIDDSLVEGAEGVLLTLSADPAYVVVTPGLAALSIADDDLGAVTIVASDPDASEAGLDPATFTLSRTGDTSAALLVSLSKAGTATNGSDYTGLGGTAFVATIPAGASSTTLTLTPLADNLVEGDETAVVTVDPSLAYVVGSPSSATATIVDDAPVVNLTAPDPDAAEAGLDPGAFLLTRSGGNLAAALDALLSVGGTATANRDYSVLSGVVTIPAGQTTAAIAVTPLPDNLVEGPETVALTLLAPTSNATYIVGSSSFATVAIADDPAVVEVVVTDPDAAEAGLDPGTVAFTRAGGDLNSALNVFFTKGGTATNGADYASLGGGVSLAVIAAGQPSVQVTIAPLADNLVEGTESAVLTLSPSSAYVIGSAAGGTVTIADDPAVVTVVTTDPDAAEAGPDPGVFTLARSGGNLAAALNNVSFILGGTARNVSDYVSIASQVDFPAGQATASVTITPVDDALVEGAETVILTVDPRTNYLVGTPGSATVTIADND